MRFHNMPLKIKNSLNSAYYVLFTLCFLITLCHNTMLISWLGDPYVSLGISYIYDFSLLVCILLVIFDFTRDIVKEKKHSAFIILVVKLSIIFTAIVFLKINGDTIDNRSMWLLLLFTCAAGNQNENTIFRIGFLSGSILTGIVFLLSIYGVLENIRGNSFGFTYNDFFSCCVMCLIAYRCIQKNGRLTWIGELAIPILAVFSHMMNSETAFICDMMMAFGVYYRHYRDIGGVPYQEKETYSPVLRAFFQILYLPVRLIGFIITKSRLQRGKKIITRIMIFSAPIAAVVSFLITISYRFLLPVWNRIPGLGSIKVRLLLGTVGFEEIPIRLFGSEVRMSASIGTEKAVNLYYVIDNSYIKILLQQGVLVFIIVMGLLIWTQYRLFKQKRFFTMFILSIFCLDNMIETSLRAFAFSLFLLLSFCRFSDKPTVKTCEKLHFQKKTTWKRVGTVCAVALAGAIMAISLSTAYSITSWRNWTPDYDATIVVPGDYVDGIKNETMNDKRLNRARMYLHSHEDAYCIVPSLSAKQWLLDQGICEERVLIDDSSESIDEMLNNSDAIIQQNNMPPRLTICTYTVQQSLISHHAKKLDIPINSLSMRTPDGLHVRNFVIEQWKLLCGK